MDKEELDEMLRENEDLRGMINHYRKLCVGDLYIKLKRVLTAITAFFLVICGIIIITGVVIPLCLGFISKYPEIINKKPRCNSPGHLSRPGTPNPITNNTGGN